MAAQEERAAVTETARPSSGNKTLWWIVQIGSLVFLFFKLSIIFFMTLGEDQLGMVTALSTQFTLDLVAFGVVYIVLSNVARGYR